MSWLFAGVLAQSRSGWGIVNGIATQDDEALDLTIIQRFCERLDIAFLRVGGAQEEHRFTNVFKGEIDGVCQHVDRQRLPIAGDHERLALVLDQSFAHSVIHFGSTPAGLPKISETHDAALRQKSPLRAAAAS